jgi:hypothetical protein
MLLFVLGAGAVGWLAGESLRRGRRVGDGDRLGQYSWPVSAGSELMRQGTLQHYQRYFPGPATPHFPPPGAPIAPAPGRSPGEVEKDVLELQKQLWQRNVQGPTAARRLPMVSLPAGGMAYSGPALTGGGSVSPTGVQRGDEETGSPYELGRPIALGF